VQAQYLALTVEDDEVGGLLDVDFLLDCAIEECTLNVHVKDFPAFVHRQRHHHANRLQAHHRCKDLIEFDAGTLDVAFGHQTHIVSYDIADFIAVYLVHPFQADRTMVGRE
jgi:hypothetical protein